MTSFLRPTATVNSREIVEAAGRGYCFGMATSMRPVGDLLRDWRQRRRLSQMSLALEADVSARHVSFLETGRAKPSREMLVRLAESLGIPLRERNELLLAAGFAPIYQEHPLDAPPLQMAREIVQRVLTGHEPFPAIAVDRHWTLIAANDAVAPLLVGVGKDLLRPPINVLRLSLHPQGLASRILNYPVWKAHLIARLQRQIEVSGDPVLVDLLDELREYRMPSAAEAFEPQPSPSETSNDVAVPLMLRTERGDLFFISTTTVFGTPVDITLSELAIEAFFPADRPLRDRLTRLH